MHCVNLCILLLLKIGLALSQSVPTGVPVIIVSRTDSLPAVILTRPTTTTTTTDGASGSSSAASGANTTLIVAIVVPLVVVLLLVILGVYLFLKRRKRQRRKRTEEMGFQRLQAAGGRGPFDPDRNRPLGPDTVMDTDWKQQKMRDVQLNAAPDAKENDPFLISAGRPVRHASMGSSSRRRQSSMSTTSPTTVVGSRKSSAHQQDHPQFTGWHPKPVRPMSMASGGDFWHHHGAGTGSYYSKPDARRRQSFADDRRPGTVDKQPRSTSVKSSQVLYYADGAAPTEMDMRRHPSHTSQSTVRQATPFLVHDASNAASSSSAEEADDENDGWNTEEQAWSEDVDTQDVALHARGASDNDETDDNASRPPSANSSLFIPQTTSDLMDKVKAQASTHPAHPHDPEDDNTSVCTSCVPLDEITGWQVAEFDDDWTAQVIGDVDARLDPVVFEPT